MADVRLGNRSCCCVFMSSAVSKARALRERLVSFASESVQVSAKLPKTMQAKHIAKQILRSGTRRIVLKQLNETVIWLDLTQ